MDGSGFSARVSVDLIKPCEGGSQYFSDGGSDEYAIWHLFLGRSISTNVSTSG